MGGFTPLPGNLSECCPAIMSRYFSLSGRQVGSKCVFILQESVSPYTICPVLIRERLHGFLLWWAELDLNQQNAETQQIYSLHRYQLRDTDPYYSIHSKGSSLILYTLPPPLAPQVFTYYSHRKKSRNIASFYSTFFFGWLPYKPSPRPHAD